MDMNKCLCDDGIRHETAMNFLCTDNSNNNTLFGGHVYKLGLDFLPGKSRKLIYEPIKQFLKKHSYDVVHVHSGSISVLAYAAKAARKSGIAKVIVHSHASGIESLKHKIIRFVFGFMLRKNVTDFLACSEEAGVMKYSSDVVRKKLVVIKNGIDIDKYKYNAAKRERIREELGLEKNFVLGHVGRFSEEKNHEYLVDVFDKIYKQILNSKLLLVGDGELQVKIQDKVKELGLEASVIFVGNVDNVQDYYQAMDVFVFPSRCEGLPFVTVEAQTAGLPCVISKGAPETVKLTDNVFRIDLADKQSWIDKIVALRNVRRSNDSESVRKAGYDIRDTAEQIRELYFQIASPDREHLNLQEEHRLRVLEITGEPILHGGQEKFIQNLIENIDHSNLTIDVLTPYYCENEAFVRTVQNGRTFL